LHTFMMNNPIVQKTVKNAFGREDLREHPTF
ncbi:MAG: hypothetical protein RLZZ69_3829, partial [Cyanobacteriota bacterium]